MAKYVNQATYADYRKDNPVATWDQIRNDPEKYGYSESDVEVKTIPGQSMTVKELMQRYKKGRPIPEE